MADDAPTMEDERIVELSTISDIFPELIIDANDSFSATLELPVKPTDKVPVVFPETPGGVSIATIKLGDDDRPPVEPREVHLLEHLPSLHLHVTLPEGYPDDVPPCFHLTTTPSWIPSTKLVELEADGAKLWEEYGRSQVVFAYIDHLQQATENAFSLVTAGNELSLTQETKIAILDFDIRARKAAFDKETFDCGICLEPKKGSVCHRMLDCGHVFCCECLQDFYNNAITEGDLASVRCLAPDCAKKRAEELAKEGKRKPKTHINPSELLQIPIQQDVVQRYVMLRRKAELESDTNTIYCPRKWCQGAARSKKHKKPTDLFEAGESSDEEDEPVNTKGYLSGEDLLAVCEDCSFAFCRRCYMGWHGESFACTPRLNTGELTAEDKASLEYMKLYSTPCPTCAAPAQKTHGCNHMICFRCNSHFCYLCSAWLEPGNPYKHFNMEILPCYMRLWELEGGDGDDVDRNAVMPEEDVEPVNEINFVHDREQAVDFDDDDPNDMDDLAGVVLGFGFQPIVDHAPAAPVNNGDAPRNPNRPAVEREAPLVLRLAAPPPPPPPPPAVEVYRGRGRGRGRGPGGDRGGGLNRGGRGGGRGRGHVHNVGYNARQQAAIERRLREQPAPGAAHAQNGELNEAEQAWVQQFVAAALVDEEDGRW